MPLEDALSLVFGHRGQERDKAAAQRCGQVQVRLVEDLKAAASRRPATSVATTSGLVQPALFPRIKPHTNPSEAPPQTDETCGGCGSDRTS